MNKQTAYFEYLVFNETKLFTVVCLPHRQGTFPTVIYRNPYVDKEECLPEAEVCDIALDRYRDWLENGYAVVVQHCRGCGKSDGCCIPYIHEREDGLFLQDWIRQQPFYNGELYLCGRSYLSSVHFVTAPFAEDIKGAVLEIQDCERYNINYRNGFFKMGLTGNWYVRMYKKKQIRKKHHTTAAFHTLPLSDFSNTVFGEPSADLDQILKHPDPEDPFWTTRFGGGEARDAIQNANIPILLTTGFYDIYTGGIFDMWNKLDASTKALSALAVNPYDHNGTSNDQPVAFANGRIDEEFPNYVRRWIDSIRGVGESPFQKGKVTYYNLFSDRWCCDSFAPAEKTVVFPLGDGEVTYRYNPYDPASFKGGLSTNFGGSAWQDPPNSRHDIISLFTEEFSNDTFVKGKMRAKLKVSSTCEDTCFYVRISLCKAEGDYGLRDDITQISNFTRDYVPGSEIDIDFSFDEHAFVIQKGEKLRIDISSSAYPHYVRHTNNQGLFSEQTTARIADNTVILSGSYFELPIA